MSDSHEVSPFSLCQPALSAMGTSHQALPSLVTAAWKAAQEYNQEVKSNAFILVANLVRSCSQLVVRSLKLNLLEFTLLITCTYQCEVCTLLP